MLRLTTLLCIALLCVPACGEEAPGRPAGGPGPAPQPPGDGAESLSHGRLLVRTAEIDIRVEDTERAREAIDGLVRSRGGYTELSETLGRSSTSPSRFVVRVPAATLDALLAEVRQLAVDVVRESTAVEDVTSRSVDLDARREALAATETELLELLKESRSQGRDARTIMDVFRELTDIRTRIEKLDGERKVLAETVALARAEILVRSDVPTGLFASGWAPLEFAGDCLGILVQVLKALGYLVIFLIVVALPVTLLVLLTIGGIRKLRGRAKPTGS